jgi:hypothetical protein
VFIAKNLGWFLRFMRAATSMRNCLFHLLISFFMVLLNANALATLSFRLAALPLVADRAKRPADRGSMDRCASLSLSFKIIRAVSS